MEELHGPCMERDAWPKDLTLILIDIRSGLMCFGIQHFLPIKKKSILICIPTLIGPRFKLVHSARVSSFMSCMIS